MLVRFLRAYAVTSLFTLLLLDKVNNAHEYIEPRENVPGNTYPMWTMNSLPDDRKGGISRKRHKSMLDSIGTITVEYNRRNCSEKNVSTRCKLLERKMSVYMKEYVKSGRNGTTLPGERRELEPVILLQNQTRCLPTDGHDDRMFICCDGKLQKRLYNSKTRCCGKEVYRKYQYTCCNGSLLPAFGNHNKRGRCCGGVSYDSACYKCFSSTKRTVFPRFDTDHEICCNGRVRKNRRGKKVCCGRVLFNPEDEMCIDGTVVERLTDASSFARVYANTTKLTVTMHEEELKANTTRRQINFKEEHPSVVTRPALNQPVIVVLGLAGGIICLVCIGATIYLFKFLGRKHRKQQDFINCFSSSIEMADISGKCEDLSYTTASDASEKELECDDYGYLTVHSNATAEPTSQEDMPLSSTQRSENNAYMGSYVPENSWYWSSSECSGFETCVAFGREQSLSNRSSISLSLLLDPAVDCTISSSDFESSRQWNVEQDDQELTTPARNSEPTLTCDSFDGLATSEMESVCQNVDSTGFADNVTKSHEQKQCSSDLKSILKPSNIEVERKNLSSALFTDMETQTAAQKETNSMNCFGKPWDLKKTIPELGGVFEKENSSVQLFFPNQKDGQGDFDVHGSVYTNVRAMRHKFNTKTEEELVSVGTEYIIPSNRKLSKYAVVKMEFIGSPEDLRVRWFMSDGGKDDTALVRDVPPRSKDNNANQDMFYVVGGDGFVFIYTKHFSGFFCTRCKQQRNLTLYALLFGSFKKSKTMKRTVMIRMYIADGKVKIKDFKQSLVEEEEKCKRRYLDHKEIRLQKQLTDSDLLAVTLTVGFQEELWHFKHHDVKQVMELSEIVACCRDGDLPAMLDWYLERSQSNTAGQDVFECCLEVMHYRKEDEESGGVRTAVVISDLTPEETSRTTDLMEDPERCEEILQSVLPQMDEKSAEKYFQQLRICKTQERSIPRETLFERCMKEYKPQHLLDTWLKMFAKDTPPERLHTDLISLFFRLNLVEKEQRDEDFQVPHPELESMRRPPQPVEHLDTNSAGPCAGDFNRCKTVLCDNEQTMLKE